MSRIPWIDFVGSCTSLLIDNRGYVEMSSHRWVLQGQMMYKELKRAYRK